MANTIGSPWADIDLPLKKETACLALEKVHQKMMLRKKIPEGSGQTQIIL